MPTWSIARRDLVAAFTSPLAWLVLACWTLLTNGLFVRTLESVHGTAGADQPLFVESLNLGVLFLALLAPAITMTSFAQERQQGTMQLLLTVPIREHHLILGKFLGAMLVLCSLLLSMLAALGVWISLLVDSPIAAYVITFAAIAVLMLIGVAPRDSWLYDAGQAVGLGARLEPFFRGDLQLGNILFFLAVTASCLLMSHSALLARRLHG